MKIYNKKFCEYIMLVYLKCVLFGYSDGLKLAVDKYTRKPCIFIEEHRSFETNYDVKYIIKVTDNKYYKYIISLLEAFIKGYSENTSIIFDNNIMTLSDKLKIYKIASN